LKNIGKGEGVPIIDVKGILEDMRTKKTVARHELYKRFLQMVQDHYSIRNDSLETDDMLAAVRSLITENAVILQDLFSKQDDDEREEILDLDVEEAWTEDTSEAGRHFYDNFVPPKLEEIDEDVHIDIEEETEDPIEELPLDSSPKATLTAKQIQEFLAATGDSGNESSDYSDSPQKRKRGRPRKLDQRPKIIILTEVKEKRGRGRPRKKPPLIPTNLEATPDEPAESDEQREKRKRGRPKKLKIAEITITTQTLCEAIKLQSPQKPPSAPSTPTTPTADKPKRGRGRPRKIRPPVLDQAEDEGATLELSASSNGYPSPENSLNSPNNQNMSPEDTGALNIGHHASNYTTFSENAPLSITEDMLEECISPQSPDLLQLVQPVLQPVVVKRKRGRPRKTRPVEQLAQATLLVEKILLANNFAEDEPVNKAKSPKKVFEPHTSDEESKSKRRRKLSIDEEKTNGRSRSKGTRVRL
jgi:hypothetical protein